VEFDPTADGQLSADRKWKRLVSLFANDRIETTITEVDTLTR
jgi:hypothetical protein